MERFIALDTTEVKWEEYKLYDLSGRQFGNEYQEPWK